MPIELGDGAIVTVAPPVLPAVRVAPPSPTSVVVLPVAGPTGPQGPPGDSAGLFGFVHTQGSVWPANTPLPITHGFTYKPAGIVALESDGEQIEYATITHPSTGVTELTFGVGFAGTIYLS